MKKSRFSDQQIAFALQQAETGSRLRMSAVSCGYPRRHYYRWKKHYGGLMPSEVRKLMRFAKR
jgi:putative transposase